MIQRKDTLGFVEYMRGKYKQRDRGYIQRLVDEMTLSEKDKLLTLRFDALWNGLWGDGVGQQYRGEHKDSKEKHKKLTQGHWGFTLQDLIDDSATNYTDTEWGIPKGRRNYQERDLAAALREFQEETGYKTRCLSVIANLDPLEECFTGSNLKSYRHVYYVAHHKSAEDPQPFQESEVKSIRWVNKMKALELIRPYNIEKMEIIQRADHILNNYGVYQ